ncbi:MAG: crossover junction endodeoxyribonuclease RuvC [Micrococcales bacterium]
MARRVLGIDPGLTRCGLAVVEVASNRKLKFVGVQTVHTSPKDELPQRLSQIADVIEAEINEHKPDLIALERVFAQANLRSVMGVAQISGVVLYLSARHGLPIQFHTPSEVKAAVTGNGRANKEQVGTMVAKLLGLSEIPKPADSADALAIAITAGWRPEQSDSTKDSESLTKAQLAWSSALRASKKSR